MPKSPLFSMTSNQSVLDWTLEATDYCHLEYYIEGLSLSLPGIRSHGGGHIGVGGQIGEVSRINRRSFPDAKHMLRM